MKRKALILCGGWDGHEPKLVSARFKDFLESEGFEVNLSETLTVLEDKDYLMSLDLLAPVWTGGQLSAEQEGPVMEAIGSGVGMAGCHGGMCDSFRTNVGWQFVTGANWVSHPGGDGTPYRVNIISSSNPLTEGIKDFDVSSEQYYLHVDPANEVLATRASPYRSSGITRLTARLTYRWCGQSAGDMGGFSITPWVITTTYSTSQRLGSL